MARTGVATVMDPERSSVLSQAVAETAKHLDIRPTELGMIIGISQSSASRLFSGEFYLNESRPEWQLSALLVRLYRGLYSIVGHNDDLARTWLKSANRAFNEKPPLEEIKTITGLVRVCDYVDAHRAPV